jgi:hypothetical protein
MARVYSVSFRGTVTAAGTDTDWFEILPADDKPVKLAGLIVSQISEVGDTAEEGLAFEILRMTATVTSGNGSATTPQLIDPADSAAGFTAETNGTTVATTSGSTAVLDAFGWNNRNSPYERWWPDPEFQPKAIQGQALVLRQQTTLADDMTAAMTAYIVEE